MTSNACLTSRSTRLLSEPRSLAALLFLQHGLTKLLHFRVAIFDQLRLFSLLGLVSVISAALMRHRMSPLLPAAASVGHPRTPLGISFFAPRLRCALAWPCLPLTSTAQLPRTTDTSATGICFFVVAIASFGLPALPL
jgi:hypothetical protein